MDLQGWLSGAVAAIAEWQEGFGPFETDPSMLVSDERFASAFAELTGRLRGNYPFFHPSYAGQMLKPAHPAAVAGYLAAMLINPNNHALDGGPATGQMEKEAVATLAAMFGLGTHLGHLTSSGTIANLEALYVARETHPGLGVAYSEEAHYTHARMCGVLGIEGTPVPADGAGRMDTGALDALLAGGRIGTVVATAGTTGLGAIDPVHEILAVARRHGARVHVDAAYGGFFTLLARGSDPPEPPGGPRPGSSVTGPWPELARGDTPPPQGQAPGPHGPGTPRGPARLPIPPSLARPASPSPSRELAGQAGEAGLDPAPWRAIAECDSVVVDPHKHGLQPYGCGAVLFADPEVGRFYLHDSPYTYFTSDELHLGRSAWSAREPARRPPRSGSPSSCCR
ncbi:MAG TPA: aminotransferase class V-fold PLP-dependent enzyme [Streptosporangiaceae bacterium]|nr:aminotransferase class V-fold PLP-dependent enzyme [Streptosporangiaceae bacterium]